ncbi:MAG: adenylate kinase [Candidatus Latescibacterota bacterium]|jgi:adenylate kinase
MDARGITADPVVISDLLSSPRAERIKAAGNLVGNEEVIELLLRKLLEPQYERGVIVDGFPRTTVQTECLKLFYDKMIALREVMRALGDELPRPLFRTVLLFVDEEVSIRRQLERGEKAADNNRKVEEFGVGRIESIRPTDLDPQMARNRYRLFKDTTYDALRSLRQIFHFHFIDAAKPLEAVQAEIEEEFSYQSSLELAGETFDRIRTIPTAGQIVLYARQELVKRLEAYNEDHPELFQHVIDLINERFMPIVTRYAITGRTVINSEDTLFENPLALTMLIDIFSERGYQALVDVNKVDIPVRINPETYEIICEHKLVYRFQIRFAASAIRRGHD